ncbi:hypothetical protein KI655_18675 [Vibrio sp. D404a]|uniref:hypothetical protein n=1 Tax=unclassified Vibrio TaxID=2614977 RepID=UPI00255778D9|nr:MULTISPECIES: hypothetical protein [unclassified Vibrio]MDK9739324.1 hypothetical protein [Vibrio sp. D404a]MDK9797641.1 hypothetical protein [Vibrio sp. D449a]
MNSHLEVVLSTQIASVRFIIAVDYINDIEAAYRVLQFNDVQKTTHDNEVLEKKEPVSNVMIHEDEMALAEYFKIQQEYATEKSSQTGLVIAFTDL